MQAQQYNLLQSILYVLIRANSKSSIQKPKPIAVPQPKKKREQQDGGFTAMAEKARANREKRITKE
ncbi:hypothetical protein HUN08_12630 [Gordonia sp. X0973]|uniref:hypothetical protein n=1 Tax=Gordonia sp. X0973 TaxID=2742602 RepID=UPI000F525DD1|nr:hypothetical protein [Gordonia sp. X0973]QKT07938.1 hypothetical protein HUN08_12630 [Gordonia sp. X0973]